MAPNILGHHLSMWETRLPILGRQAGNRAWSRTSGGNHRGQEPSKPQTLPRQIMKDHVWKACFLQDPKYAMVTRECVE